MLAAVLAGCGISEEGAERELPDIPERQDEESPIDKKEETEEAAEDDMALCDYVNMDTDAWKTEEYYKRTEDGTVHFQEKLEYDSNENLISQIYYQTDGSIFSICKWDNWYTGEGKLLKTIGSCSQIDTDGTEDLNEYIREEYDENGRVVQYYRYDTEWNIRSEISYEYEYDAQTDVWSCHHMSLNYDENGEYVGSGASNHELYSYDEANRIAAHFSYPIVGQCYMYDKTEEQIRQDLQGISLESENALYRKFAEMEAEYGEDALIDIYRYDGNGILQEIDSYSITDMALQKKTSCTYEYDSGGNVRTGCMESVDEAVYITYNREDAPKNCAINDITWEETESPYGKAMLQFMLEDGSVVTREAAYDGIVERVEYKDITGDGIEEAFVFINMPNNIIDQYFRIAVYQIQEGKPVDLSPVADVPETLYWNTMMAEEEIPGYGIVLQMESYGKKLEGNEPRIIVTDRMTIAYQDGAWKVIQRESEPEGLK